MRLHMALDGQHPVQFSLAFLEAGNKVTVFLNKLKSRYLFSCKKKLI